MHRTMSCPHGHSKIWDGDYDSDEWDQAPQAVSGAISEKLCT